MNSFTLRQGRDSGEIISDTFGYFRSNFKSLSKGLFIFSLPLILISGVLIGTGFGEIFGSLNEGAAANPNFTSFGFKFLLGFIVFAFTVIALTIITLNHIRLIDKGVATEDIKPSDLLENMGSNILSLIFFFMIVGIPNFLSSIVFGSVGSGGMQTMLLFGFFIFYIYYTVKLSLVPALLIIDEVSLGEAITGSWSLTSGNWWFTFLALFVVTILVYIMSMVLILPAYFFIMIFAISAGDPSSMSFGTIFGVVYALFVIALSLLYCFPVITQALLYFSLEEKKSGKSLSARIDALENTQN